MTDYTLFYWPIPFRGQFVRAVLAHVGARHAARRSTGKVHDPEAVHGDERETLPVGRRDRVAHLAHLERGRVVDREAEVELGTDLEVHHDLDRLFESATEPEREGSGPGLDVRLVGHPDPGRQTLSTDGPLVGEPAT